MFFKRVLLCAAIAALSAAALAAPLNLPVAGAVGDVPFPSPERAWLARGDFVNVENLRQMKPGLGKQQVRILLGSPHFREGIAGVDEWNYIFNFRTGVGEAFITCQYQVRYEKDPDYVVNSMHWDGPACQELLNGEPAPAPVAEAPPAAPVQRVDLSADALFAFARSGTQDILPKGQEELTALAQQLSSLRDVNVRVEGHTDRIGSDASNQALSQQRAATVRQFLIGRGVPAGRIVAEGRGESAPVTTGCADSLPRAALIECLQPDRRVVLFVEGVKPE